MWKHDLQENEKPNLMGWWHAVHHLWLNVWYGLPQTDQYRERTLVKYLSFLGCTLEQNLQGQWWYEVWHVTNFNWVWSRSLDIWTMTSWVLSQKLLSSSLSLLTSLFHLSDRPELYVVLQTPSKDNSTIWAKNISVKGDDWKCQKMMHCDSDSSYGVFILH